MKAFVLCVSYAVHSVASATHAATRNTTTTTHFNGQHESIKSQIVRFQMHYKMCIQWESGTQIHSLCHSVIPSFLPPHSKVTIKQQRAYATVPLS